MFILLSSCAAAKLLLMVKSKMRVTSYLFDNSGNAASVANIAVAFGCEIRSWLALQ